MTLSEELPVAPAFNNIRPYICTLSPTGSTHVAVPRNWVDSPTLTVEAGAEKLQSDPLVVVPLT